LTAIIILALVALFIGLRLYSVLGERTGHEQPILKPADPEADARMEPQPHPRTTSGIGLAEPDELAYLPMAGPGVRALLATDASFDVGRFLEGSKAAYRMILEAFWKGDVEAMKPYVDAHVFETFAGAVEQRTKDGLVLDNRLVAIDQAVIAAAEVERDVALVTVRFEADIAAITRNSAGEVVAGSLSDAVQTRDRWTFRRNIASRDPNWLLVETDEEE
jgi:predicted lipid-binding transport protein (Tim44 family)